MATTKVTIQESSNSKLDSCKCGESDCVGHEVIDGQFQFPGFTSHAVMLKSPHELVYFKCHVTKAFRDADQ